MIKKPTPGPWTVRKAADSDHPVIFGSNDRLIAVIDGDCTYAEDWANARLIIEVFNTILAKGGA